MNYSDRLAFMPLRFLMPLLWLIIIIDTSVFSYLYVKSELQLSVKEDFSKQIKARFLYANRNLNNALEIGLSKEELLRTQDAFESEEKVTNIIGYIDGEGEVNLLSQGHQGKGLEYFLKDDFKDNKELLHEVRQKMFHVQDESLVWANKDVFYIFRPLFSNDARVHFLRYSIEHERAEHVDALLHIIFLYTIALLGAMLIIGLLSYFVVNDRLKRLLTLISGYKQGMSEEKKPITGYDEISAISKAFCEVSHRLNAVLDDMYTFVAVLDPNGKVMFVNNTPLQVSQLEFADVQGKFLNETFWWEYDDKMPAQIGALLERCVKGEIINQETQIQIADGRLIWINFCMHPVYDIDGNVEHLVAEGVDISAQKEAYQKMLTQSRKAQMGEMLSVIAHQWRQPLSIISAIAGKNIIDGELEMIKAKELVASMHTINETVSHLGATMQQFTSFFDPNKKPKETSFRLIVEKCMKILSSDLESKGIVVESKVTEECIIESFEEELLQVLMDMLKNSADFFGENKIKSPRILLTQSISDDTVCLIIEDNAGGIKDEDLAHLFDPYFSTKLQEQGTGLGLHMSKMIVEEHCNGKIEVEQIMNGARFTISLPR